MHVSGENFDVLMNRYLDVCNKAIEENKEDFFYKRVWGISERIFKTYHMHIAVYDDRVKNLYVLRYADHKISEDRSVKPDFERSWHINYSYLKHVVDNPEQYIKHPAKLDWDWLKNKVA
jgi:hypothetical protein